MQIKKLVIDCSKKKGFNLCLTQCSVSGPLSGPQALDSYLTSDGRRAQNWVNGALHFLSLHICFDQSCCWRRGPVTGARGSSLEARGGGVGRPPMAL